MSDGKKYQAEKESKIKALEVWRVVDKGKDG